MVVDLPYTLTVNGEEREIYCDFRDIILICNCFNDPELSKSEKNRIMLNNLYVDDWLEFGNIEEAIKKAVWFIDWGKEYKEEQQNAPRIMDWEQDFNMIISAVDKSVKTAESCLELPFMHWWTFLTKFSERGECQFSSITGIRDKLNKNKKLDGWEKEVLRDNRETVILKSEAAKDFEKEMWGE